MLIKISGAIAYFMLLPFLMGLAYSKFKNRKRQEGEYVFSNIYMYGYIIYFALFYCYWLIVKTIRSEAVLYRPVLVWGGILLVLAALCVGYTGKELLAGWRRIRQAIDNRKKIGSPAELLHRYGILIAGAGLILLSVGCIEPSVEDTTIETGRRLLEANLISFEGTAAIELFYVFYSLLFGAGLVQSVHLFVPIGLLVFFFCVYQWIGQRLFIENEEQQRSFFYIAILFYLVMTFAVTYIGLTPFQNIWNGTTLAVSCLLPVELVNMTMLIPAFRVLKQGKDRRKGQATAQLSFLVAECIMTGLAAYLCMSGSGGLCLFLLILTLIIA